ncbi:MAG: nucleotidyl transferase AbiEii/AbiGii toxin family protein [Flavobacteriales bacterium]
MKELKMLMPETGKVLQKLANLDLLKDFTFVGGTALTYHLSHRYSEDIDLFTWNNRIDTLNIQRQIEKAGFNTIKAVDLSDKQADFLLDGVKVTFFADDWNELKNREQIHSKLYIANLQTIGVMKINTLFLRAKFRDYYDLYVLSLEHFSVPELYELTKNKMSNLTMTLFQRALIFTKDIEDENIDHFEPKYNVTIQQIEDHFHNEVKKWIDALN